MPSSERMRRINELLGETNSIYHDIALSFGLAQSSLDILYAICQSGDSCRLSDICRLMGMSKQTLNSALRKLEGDGAVYLEAAGGRHKRVCLTESGKRLASETAMRVIDAENSVLSEWSQKDVEMYLELSEKFNRELRAKWREGYGCGQKGEENK